MIRKLKIKLYNGSLTQYRIFNIPVFEIEKNNLNKFKIRLNLFNNTKPDKNKMLFYLKVSRNVLMTFKLLQKWIDIINLMNADFYILCDDKDLEKKILENICFYNCKIKIIKSNKYCLQNAIKNSCDKKWENVGYAHLTTFTNSKKYKIENFWNIDADDMIFLENNEKIAKILTNIADYASANNYDVLSYDVLRSLWNGKHWCFGIVYVNNNTSVFNALKTIKNRKWENKYFKVKQKLLWNLNFDWLFTYFLDTKQLKISCFNIKNLLFLNLYPIFNIFSVQNLKDNFIIYPYAKAFSECEQYIKHKLFDDVVVFEYDYLKTENKYLQKIFDDYKKIYNYFEN